jgi:murein L,D-transpeptidase YafK
MTYSRRAILALALALPAACSKFKTYDGPPVTSVVVYKADRRLYLMNGNTVLRDFPIALGGNPIGPKQVEGDGKTPEGAYFINRRNPNSQYHLSLGISYPNAEQVAAAAAMGKKPGGDIFIHGRDGKNRGRGRDWTVGCIAVKDREMEDIYAMVRVGTPIFIFP